VARITNCQQDKSYTVSITKKFLNGVADIHTDITITTELEPVNIDEDATYFIYSGEYASSHYTKNHTYFGESGFLGMTITYMATHASSIIVYRTRKGGRDRFRSSFEKFVPNIYTFKFVQTLNRNEYYVKIIKKGIHGNELIPSKYISAIPYNGKWIITAQDFSKASRVLLIKRHHDKVSFKILNGYNQTTEVQFTDKYIPQSYNITYSTLKDFWHTEYGGIGQFDIRKTWIPNLTPPTPFEIRFISSSSSQAIFGLRLGNNNDYIYSHSQIMYEQTLSLHQPRFVYELISPRVGTKFITHSTEGVTAIVFNLSPNTSYYFQAWNFYTNHSTTKSITILVKTSS
jgi:hypothetical protein